MSDFYGIRPGTIPGFAEAGGTLAFEVCLRHVASVIEDQRRAEGKTDPRENLAP